MDQNHDHDYEEYPVDDARPFSPEMNDQMAPGPSGDLDVSEERAAAGSGVVPGGMTMDDRSTVRGTIVGPAATFSGTLSSDGPVTVMGVLEGEIMAAGDVTIAPEATVRARIQAITLQVAGRFQGSVACTHRFEVLETGRVEADILAPAIVVHDGATINGRFRIRNDDETAEPVDSSAESQGETGGTDTSGFEGSE